MAIITVSRQLASLGDEISVALAKKLGYTYFGKKEIENREKNLARIKAKQEKLHAEALETAKKIEALGTLEFSAKAGESGKLFGAITTKRLAEELKEKLGIEVDRKVISLDAPVNKLGDYTMMIKLTSKVKASLGIHVTASEILKEEIKEEETTTEE